MSAQRSENESVESTARPPRPENSVRATRLRPACVVLAVVATGGLIGVVAAQVEVTSDPAGVTRACGSSLDSIVDRSGWETWWAADLDDPDPAARAELVRTRLCPGAVNTRLAFAAGLGLVALLSAALVARSFRAGRQPSKAGERVEVLLRRLGTLTAMVGSTLTAGGGVALAFLVADADSTLFLYTDRLVVALVGLIVLMPPVALLVLGRALRLSRRRLTPPSPCDGRGRQWKERAPVGQAPVGERPAKSG